MKERTEQGCRELFAWTDEDGNGYITSEDYILKSQKWGDKISQEDIEEFKRFIAKWDENKDGKISYEEFRKYYFREEPKEEESIY